MHYKEHISRDQMMMLSYDNMIGPDNAVRLIDLVCRKFIEDNPEQMNWKGQENKGRKCYPAHSMLGLLTYGYFHGITSSRKLEHQTIVNIELIWLTEGLSPDHWTICEFRRNSGNLIKPLLKKFRQFLLDSSFASMDKIAFDGTKLKAYSSRDMLTVDKIKAKLGNINKSLAEYLAQLEGNDINDEELKTANDKISELQALVEKLEKEKSKLESNLETLENKDGNYLSPNDPEANLVKGRDGYFAGYNGQIGVEADNHFIMSDYITDTTNDTNELSNNFELAVSETNIVPNEILADKGYANSKQILEIEDKGKTKCYIPFPETKREKLERKKGIAFTYDKENDQYKCHQGNLLVYTATSNDKSGVVFKVYKCKECNGCQDREKCTSSKTGRTIKRNVNQDKIDDYKNGIEDDYSKEMRRQRKQIVEHPFGTMKILMGKFNLLLKGLDKVRIEFSLYVLAYNLKRLRTIAANQNIMIKIKHYDWKIEKMNCFWPIIELRPMTLNITTI